MPACFTCCGPRAAPAWAPGWTGSCGTGSPPYAALVERGGEDPALAEAARRDIETFAALAELGCGRLLEAVGGAAPPELEGMLGPPAPVGEYLPL